MDWFHALMPKEDKFFVLFDRHAQTLIGGAKALRGVLAGGDQVDALCAEIMRHEEEADTVAREVLLAVRRTFITPFDRSDIRGLTNSIDDSIDQMQKTAKAIRLYEVHSFEPHMRELGEIIVEVADLTAEAVSLLPKIQKNSARLNALTERITRLESKSDDIYDAGMKALFLKSRGQDAMGYIVGAELYDKLEKVVDRFEDVANRINGILVEHL